MFNMTVAATALNAVLLVASPASAQTVPASSAPSPSDPVTRSAAHGATLPLPHIRDKRPITPSTGPGETADRHLFEAPRLGLRMLVTAAKAPGERQIFWAKGDAVLNRLADDQDSQDNPLITFYPKRAEQSVQDAIRDRFIHDLPPEARDGCRVRRTKKDEIDLGPGRQTFIIDSFGRYGAKIQRKYADSPGDSGCGEHGWRQENAYFEYHPEQDRTRYMYVYLGWDPAPFDDRSIDLKPVPPAAARDAMPALTTTR